MSEKDPRITHMIEKARAIMSFAYSPYSKFKVGCCICADNDELFVGCNIENVSYGLTICAESSAISAMISAGKSVIKDIVIICSASKACPPCGACRQRLAEFSSFETRVHLVDADGSIRTFKLADLLPLSFNKTLLGD